MKTIISDEILENVSILAKLELNEEEREQARSDMAKMLDYIDTLNTLDTEGIEPLSHTLDIVNVLREDVVTNGDGSEAALCNAPAQKDGMYQVPRTFEA